MNDIYNGNDFSVALKPTDEWYFQKVDGVDIPLRVWEGVTNDGIYVFSYMLSIAPQMVDDFEKFKLSLPCFMVKSSSMYSVGDAEKDKGN